MARERRNRAVSREAFLREVESWCRRVGVTPVRVQIQPMTRKWASCSTEGRITYAYDLLAQPPKVRDEVIVHELVHLLVPNHGKVFKASMRAYLPGWGTENSEVGLSCRSAIVTEKS